ncbi:flagellar basal-body MS-ring/collar protein FliF [Actibacterium sp. 188UL27-1]|uniref:flagellar basal-body MS-ring/collar protein FliF n=1 Tax=Actibacterium sp. 188UL27-1 TaxID=2786961 RepID=UPI0019590FF3|nr:flagellar M-ring protein FliF [Actibacterium sp. 188UL27-1]
MQNLVSIWSSLDARRRVIVVLATIAVFASVMLMSRMASNPNMTLLYAGLDNSAAGEVVQSLEQRGEPYDVRGGSIFVPSARRDELRMTLASEGLPAAGAAGYELLDGLSGFGTTSQMFDAAYWRAKEGELARTMLASPLVSSARVHISAPDSQPFRRSQTAAASVFISPAQGGLSPAQAKAFRYLVASAVTGLSADAVSVIDGSTGVVIAGDEPEAGAQLNSDRATALKNGVERLLEAHVGRGNAIVELSVETETASEAITERRFDPDSRVAISTDTEERTNSESGENANVTVASNLPDGDAAAGGSSSSQNSETRERVNFEVSETQREILKAPGAVTRLTVAVLVDGRMTVDANGAEQWAPRSQEELDALEELVASAVGYSEVRGDVITIKSLQFEAPAPLGTEASPSLLQNLNVDLTHLIQIAILALVAVAISLFVVRPILTKPQPEIAAAPALASPAPPPAAVAASAPAVALDGEIESGFDLPDVAGNQNFDFNLESGGEGLPDLASLGGETADPVDRLRQMIEERQDETLEVLRGWMQDEKESV